jgi:hypothetical protein
MVQENQLGLKLNGTHQLLANADNVNLLEDNTDTINKNIKTLIDTNKEAGIGITLKELSICALLSCHQNVGQTHDKKKETYQHLIHEEMRRLNSGNACNQSAQNLLSSHLLSKNLKIRIYQTMILHVVLYGCKTWSLTLREERRLRVFENWVLKRIFRLKSVEVKGGWIKLYNEDLHNLYSLPSIIRMIDLGDDVGRECSVNGGEEERDH